MNSTEGPLHGCRVLDMGRMVAAPYACQILGDFGADVIKLERPGRGDDARHYAEARLGASGSGDSAIFVAVNRNKRSVTVDHSTAAGQDIIRRLVADADVLVENFKTGALARYGLDYASLRAVNPRLIYCSVTGYGQDGPYASRPGVDPIFQAQSGFMSMNGEEGTAPLGTTLHVMDIVTGHNAAMAVLAALRERDQRSGQGQHIDMALMDCAFAMMSTVLQQTLVSGRQPARLQPGGRNQGASGTYECADGQILIVAYRNGQFSRLCEILGCADMAKDAKFASPRLRAEHASELVGLLAARIRGWSVLELCDALASADVPAGAVNDFNAAIDEPQIASRQMTPAVEHPDHPGLRLIANPAKFSRTPVSYKRPPPRLGEHTNEMLTTLLHMDQPAIDALKGDGNV